MTISVWRNGAYDYYEASGQGEDPPVPHHLTNSRWLSPDEAAWNLPFGAKPTGRGALPKGMIASPGGLPLGDFDLSDTKTLVIGGIALLGLLWFLNR